MAFLLPRSRSHTLTNSNPLSLPQHSPTLTFSFPVANSSCQVHESTDLLHLSIPRHYQPAPLSLSLSNHLTLIFAPFLTSHNLSFFSQYLIFSFLPLPHTLVLFPLLTISPLSSSYLLFSYFPSNLHPVSTSSHLSKFNEQWHEICNNLTF